MGFFCANRPLSPMLPIVYHIARSIKRYMINFFLDFFFGKFGKVLGWRPLLSPKGLAPLPTKNPISTPASPQLACESLPALKKFWFVRISLFSQTLFETRKCLCQNKKRLTDPDKYGKETNQT